MKIMVNFLWVKSNQIFCCLYKNNYLCVTSSSYNIIRVWDLVNKVIYKQIEYQGK